MTSHVFHEIYLHFNWHTKNDAPLITPRLEPVIHSYIRDRIVQTDGVFFHRIGGTETHIHLVINVTPALLLSEFIGQLKGACSHDINAMEGAKVLDWQRGYGVVSFAKSQLAWVLRYVDLQKDHHAHGTLSPRLELSADELLRGGGEAG